MRKYNFTNIIAFELHRIRNWCRFRQRINTEGYSESTEPIDAVNILPLTRFEPTTSATPPSTTPDADATNCATETSPKKDAQEALLTTTDAVHVVYWVFFQWMASISFASESLMDPRIQVKLDKYQKCRNIISQTSLLSSYTGSETDADSDSG